jgi:hypothetical protein
LILSNQCHWSNILHIDNLSINTIESDHKAIITTISILNAEIYDSPPSIILYKKLATRRNKDKLAQICSEFKWNEIEEIKEFVSSISIKRTFQQNLTLEEINEYLLKLHTHLFIYLENKIGCQSMGPQKPPFIRDKEIRKMKKQRRICEKILKTISQLNKNNQRNSNILPYNLN